MIIYDDSTYHSYYEWFLRVNLISILNSPGGGLRKDLLFPFFYISPFWVFVLFTFSLDIPQLTFHK